MSVLRNSDLAHSGPFPLAIYLVLKDYEKCWHFSVVIIRVGFEIAVSWFYISFFFSLFSLLFTNSFSAFTLVSDMLCVEGTLCRHLLDSPVLVQYVLLKFLSMPDCQT